MADKIELFPGKGIFLARVTDVDGVARLVFVIDVSDKDLSFGDGMRLARLLQTARGKKFELQLIDFKDRSELKEALGDELDAAIEGDGVPEVIGMATVIKPAPTTTAPLAPPTATATPPPTPAPAHAAAGVP